MNIKLLLLIVYNTLFIPCAMAASSCELKERNGGPQVIFVTLFCSFFAQFLKVITKYLKTGTVDFRLMTKSGGMPSSHSCCTMGMAISVGLLCGFASVSFAIALSLAFIVMYDAAGVRRAVGIQAKILNQIVAEIFSNHSRLSTARIKEFLGHTPKEVLIGAILGTIIAYIANLAFVKCS